MKIIKNLMIKKLENEEMLAKAKRRQFAYEEHLSVYLMALAYLGLNDSNLERKKITLRKFLSAVGKSRLKYHKRLLKFKQGQTNIILKAFDKIEEEKENRTGDFGSLYQPYTIGVASFEFEANE